MSDSPTTSTGEVVNDIEAALAAGDGQGAMRLIEANLGSLPDAKSLYMRAWNLIAWGVDHPEMFALEQIRNHSRAAAEQVVKNLRARHQFRNDLDDPVATLHDIDTRFALHKRDYPWLCFQLVTHGCLTRHGVHELIRWAWTSAEFPEEALGAQAWILVFNMAQGVVTDRDDDQPEHAGSASSTVPEVTAPHDTSPGWPPGATLWRGATPDRAAGMAWSGDRDRAEWFARRFEGMGPGHAQVWELSTAQLPASRLLGRFVHRGEDEYVLDTSGLILGTDIHAV